MNCFYELRSTFLNDDICCEVLFSLDILKVRMELTASLVGFFSSWVVVASGLSGCGFIP